MTRLRTILRRQMRPIRDTDRVYLTLAGVAALDAANEAEASMPADAPMPSETVQEAAVSVRQAYDGPADGQPKPEWIRGECPQCGAAVVANSYYCGGRGFIVVHECWNSLSAEPSCTHRKVL